MKGWSNHVNYSFLRRFSSLSWIDVEDDDGADHAEDVSQAEGDDEDGGDEEQEVEVLKLMEIRVIKAQPMQLLQQAGNLWMTKNTFCQKILHFRTHVQVT